MKTRVNLNDLDITGVDGGGIPILYYNGKPFTGIMFQTENAGTLSYEQEYVEGFLEGQYRSYYASGKVNEEYVSHNNLTVAGTYKKWDEDGNLIDSF